MAHVHPALTALSIALPGLLLAGELTVLAPRVLPEFHWDGWVPEVAIDEPVTTMLAPGIFDYRRSGAFLRNGDPIDGPIEKAGVDTALEITTNQVSAADYLRCVADDACKPVKHMPDRTDLPATGVSFDDAEDFARWLSARTGSTWRLPSDKEWAFAAADRFHDDALRVDDNGANPAVRWLAAYRVSADRAPPHGPQPVGTYGHNENGLADMAGNVWEWTSSCYVRTTLHEDGSHKSVITNCGVRIAEGAHRAYISRFVRDAKAGGCSAGIPPELLGFRLVRERSRWQDPLGAVSRVLNRRLD